MILIEVAGGGERRFHLEFHPRLTVVADLNEHQRQELITAISCAMHGAEVPMTFNVDVGGVPQPLTAPLMASIGLTNTSVDNVIRAADLPGAIVTPRTPAPRSPATESQDHRASLADATRLLQALQMRHDQTAQDLEVLSEDPSQSFEATPEEEAVIALHRAEDVLATAQEELGAYDRREAPDANESRLRALQATISQRVEALSEVVEEPLIDPVHVHEAAVAVFEAESTKTEAPPVPEPGLLAWEIRSVEAEIADASKPVHVPAWLLESTEHELAEARSALAALEQHAQRSAVQAGELEAARHRVHDAEESWGELQSGNEELLVPLRVRRDELLQRGAEMLGIAVELVTVVELERAQRAIDDEPTPRERLQAALADVGVVARGPELLDVTTAWLTQQVALIEDRERAHQELAEAALDLEDVERQLGALPVQREQYEAEGRALRDAHERAQADVEALEAEVARLRAASDGEEAQRSARLQALREELARLTQEIAQASEEVARLKPLAEAQASITPSSALAGDTFHDDGERPWWDSAHTTVERAVPLTADVDVDVSQVDADELEYYVFTRAATLRRAAIGEAVPLLIDGALDDLPIQTLLRILNILPRIAPVVQVIYLGTTDAAESWAMRQSEMTAAVVRVERTA